MLTTTLNIESISTVINQNRTYVGSLYAKYYLLKQLFTMWQANLRGITDKTEINEEKYSRSKLRGNRMFIQLLEPGEAGKTERMKEKANDCQCVPERIEIMFSLENTIIQIEVI